MTCFYPLPVYSARPPATGIVFKVTSGYYDKHLSIPCGQCQGCRKEYARQWSVRMQHEAATTHEIIRGNQIYNSSFITLTYDEANLPADESLDLSHWQLFAQRLRNALGPFRYFMCGEYGEATQRPHYHAIIFGHDFYADRRFHKRTPNGDILYTSKTLESLWPYGFCPVGDVSPAACSYVAHYVMKKANGPLALEKYARLDLDGTPYQVAPEFHTMSQKPGLGHEWIHRYMADVYPSDEIITKGHKAKPPKYYDAQLEKISPETHKSVKQKRRIAAKLNLSENTPERLYVRETCFDARQGNYARDQI